MKIFSLYPVTDSHVHEIDSPVDLPSYRFTRDRFTCVFTQLQIYPVTDSPVHEIDSPVDLRGEILSISIY